MDGLQLKPTHEAMDRSRSIHNSGTDSPVNYRNSLVGTLANEGFMPCSRASTGNHVREVLNLSPLLPV